MQNLDGILRRERDQVEKLKGEVLDWETKATLERENTLKAIQGKEDLKVELDYMREKVRIISEERDQLIKELEET